MSEQQIWAFEVDVDGAGNYQQLGGQYELPEFTPNNYSLRDATTIAVAKAQDVLKSEFNKLKEPQEFGITCDLLTDDPVQIALDSAIGDNAGISVRVVLSGSAHTLTYTFDVLVKSKKHLFSSSSGPDSKEQVTYDLKQNGPVQESKVAA